MLVGCSFLQWLQGPWCLLSGWPSANIHCVELKPSHAQMLLWPFSFLSREFLELGCFCLTHCLTEIGKGYQEHACVCLSRLRGELESAQEDMQSSLFTNELKTAIYGIYPSTQRTTDWWGPPDGSSDFSKVQASFHYSTWSVFWDTSASWGIPALEPVLDLEFWFLLPSYLLHGFTLTFSFC